MTAGIDEPFGDRPPDPSKPAETRRYLRAFGRYYFVPMALRNLPGNIGFYCGLTGLIWALVPVLGFVIALPMALVAVGFGVAGYVGMQWLAATNTRRALLGTIFGLVSFVMVGFGGGRFW
jgi:hypothetical protein